ncbi:MAG: transposase [Cephaloticoccus sp.]|nr:transposase [Cephaloticoccus sp.]MCF7760090.1 transposase [Cephaloticoccus sp.]
MLNPAKGHAALRRGRWSVPGATYFLTICTQARQTGLDSIALAPSILQHARALSVGWNLRTAVVMPDHVHLVVELRADETLSSSVRKFKGLLSVIIRRHGIKWQRAYFDHRMRTKEDLLPVFLYVFLNPYRAMLIDTSQRWPAYYCSAADWIWFGDLTNCCHPVPAWLA